VGAIGQSKLSPCGSSVDKAKKEFNKKYAIAHWHTGTLAHTIKPLLTRSRVAAHHQVLREDRERL
jgi:hypothetical protein